MGGLELRALCSSIWGLLGYFAHPGMILDWASIGGLLGYFVHPGMISGWVSESWVLCIKVSEDY